MPELRTSASRSMFRIAPRCEALEDRITPTVSVRFDYTYDTSGFFNSADRRAALDDVAATITADMNDSLAAIAPGAGNTWRATALDSATHSQLALGSLSIAADQVVIFITAGNIGGALGIASGGAYSASGSQDWLGTVRTRGQAGVDGGTDFSTWGGLIAFNSAANFSFSGSPTAAQYDFKSVASHEMMHIFGFGLENPSYTRYASTGAFTGPNVEALTGYAVPLQSGDADHFAPGTRFGGQESIMTPSVAAGRVKHFGALEAAALRDIGWGSSPAGPAPAAPAGGAAPGAAAPAPAPIPTSPVVAGSFAPAQDPIAVSLGNGQYQLYRGAPGGIAAVGDPVTAFAGYRGPLRIATGDVNGDGIPDIIVAAGPGGGPHVEIFDGATGRLIESFFAFDPGFTGGIFVAAGDIEHSGRADVIVTPDVGGGTHVRIFSGGDPNRLFASFMGIDAPGFLGGARAAAGDVNGDGYADIVVTAGPGGGSHTAIWDGRSLAQGRLVRLTADFFAFDPATANAADGVSVAAADVDGDGFADLAFGAGNRVRVLSGRAAALRGGAAAAANPNNDFYVGDSTVQPSVRVAGGAFDGDGRGEILIGSGAGQAGRLSRLSAGGLMAWDLSDGPLAQGIYVG